MDRIDDFTVPQWLMNDGLIKSRESRLIQTFNAPGSSMDFLSVFEESFNFPRSREAWGAAERKVKVSIA